MKLRSLARRPSASIIISSAALFMSLGGVGYAAVSIPNNSVGSNQIKNDAVTYKKIKADSVGNVRLANNGVSSAKLANNSVSFKKIQPQAVGRVRANLDQLQARLSSSCPGGSAIGSVDNTGKVACNSVLPNEYGTPTNTVNVGKTAVGVSAATLPAGPSYLASANPTASVTSGAAPARVTVACTITVGSATQTRSVVIPTSGTSGQTSGAAVPLQVAGPAGAAGVSCTATVPNGGTPPTTTVSGSMNALSVASTN